MSDITFLIETGSTVIKRCVPAQKGQSLLDAALNRAIPLEHACERCCACATCHVIVQKGASQLSNKEEREEDMLDHAWNSQLDSRLSCQATVLNTQEPITVFVPKWSLDPTQKPCLTDDDSQR